MMSMKLLGMLRLSSHICKKKIPPEEQIMFNTHSATSARERQPVSNQEDHKSSEEQSAVENQEVARTLHVASAIDKQPSDFSSISQIEAPVIEVSQIQASELQTSK